MAKVQHNRPVRIRDKSAITTKKFAVIPTTEGKQATIAERAQAPPHRPRLDLRGVQFGKRQSRGPKQAMNMKDIGSDAVTSNGEEDSAKDDRQWKQRYPPAIPESDANCDPETNKRRERSDADERLAPGRPVFLHGRRFALFSPQLRFLSIPERIVAGVTVSLV